MIVRALRNVLENCSFPRSKQPSWNRFFATRAPPSARASRDGDQIPLVPRNFRKPSRERSPRRHAPIEKSGSKKFVATEPTKHLLRPPVLSSRLKKLCDEGQVDEAVSMLKNAPLDAQNTPVWNTLIWECMKVKRFKLAYELFIDMKRRGFSPSTRTFQTIFSGLSRIEHWPSHAKQLVNAHAIYNYFQRHLDAVKEHDPQSPELNVTPIALYVKILGDAGEYQRIFDVYNALDQHGPLSPNQFIFTAMFRALSERCSPDDGTPNHVQNASDAKLLWRQMLKASERSPGFPVDSHVVSAAIIALSRGRAADQSLALEIVREYLGLTKPEDVILPGKIPLTVQTFAAALSLCNQMRNYKLCMHFLKLVTGRPEKLGGVSIIDRGHMEEVIKAFVAMANFSPSKAPHQALQTLQWMLKQEISGNGPKIRPTATTYNLVLMACWRGADWISAKRTFELMTGYSAEYFEDGRDTTRSPVVQKRTKGRNLVPDAETMSCMVRTALASRNLAYIRQSLRMVSQLGADHLFGLLSEVNWRDTSKGDVKHATFYRFKLAAAVVEAIDHIFPRDRASSDEESTCWTVLKARARQVLRRTNEGLQKSEEGVEVSHATESDNFTLGAHSRYA